MTTSNKEKKVVRGIVQLYRHPDKELPRIEARHRLMSVVSVITLLYPMVAVVYGFGPRWSIALVAFAAGIVNSTVGWLRLTIARAPLCLRYTALKEEAVAEFERDSGT